MRLVVDTSVLVGEVLRSSGRELLHHEHLELFLPQHMWEETVVEVPRRIASYVTQHGLDRSAAVEMTRTCLATIGGAVSILLEPTYGAFEAVARERSLRDPDDWPVVASAMAVGGAIWTHDHDFLGTGIATWTTHSLRHHLDRLPAD